MPERKGYTDDMRSPEVVQDEFDQQALGVVVGVLVAHDEIGKHLGAPITKKEHFSLPNGKRVTTELVDNLSQRLRESAGTYKGFMHTFGEIFPVDERVHVINTAFEDFDKKYAAVMHGSADIDDLDEAAAGESRALKERTRSILERMRQDLTIRAIESQQIPVA